VQGWSGSHQHAAAAYQSGGKEAPSEIREHEAFSGHQGAQLRLGVVAFQWLVGGKAKAQGLGKGRKAVACHHDHHHVLLEFTHVFLLSVSMKKVANEFVFYILKYMISFHFIVFVVLAKTYPIFLTYLTLSLADTHVPYSYRNEKRMAKYAHTYIRGCTHKKKKTKKKKQNQKGAKNKKKKRGRGRKKEKGGG